jgi:hypothetical protein
VRARARLATRTVVIVGVHRHELDFGDGVARLLHTGDIDVLRIPHGIEQPRAVPGDRFRSLARHREIYLQVRQQIRRRYDLAIDVHCGYDEQGHAADIFCHQARLLDCLASRIDGHPDFGRLRLLRIIDEHTPRAGGDRQGPAHADARTWIPRRVWLDVRPLYVGLEIYLAGDAAGEPDDWMFARRLIDTIRACHSPASGT